MNALNAIWKGFNYIYQDSTRIKINVDWTSCNISWHPHCLILTRVNKVRFATLTPAEATDTLLLIDSAANLASVTRTVTRTHRRHGAHVFAHTYAHALSLSSVWQEVWLASTGCASLPLCSGVPVVSPPHCCECHHLVSHVDIIISP